MAIMVLLHLFVVYTLLSCGFAEPRNCPAGFFLSNSKCTPCPPGTFRTGWFSEPRLRCIPCPKGTFNPFTGGVTEDVCRPCFVDTIAPSPGATSCTPCPSGMTANRRASVCLRCGPGTQASGWEFDAYADNRDRCIPCPRNTYSSGVSNRECTPCPTHKAAPRGAKSRAQCAFCPPGKEEDRYGKDGCGKCREGTIKPGLSGRCINCPRGFITDGEGKKKCQPCPVGTRGHQYRNRCVPCKPGFESFSPGSTRCRRKGTTCPSGTFENSGRDCVRCAEGEFLDVEEGMCKECPDGTFSKGGTAKKCRPCPPGKQPSVFKDRCICPDGMFQNSTGTCSKCPPGYIGFGDDECYACEAGTKASGYGNTKCTPCPVGTVAEGEGNSKCRKCPVGTMPNVPTSSSNGLGVGCVLTNTACPAGWAVQRAGASSGPIFGCRRITCKVGTPKQDIGVKCVPCLKGEALNEKGTRCRRCPRNSVSDGGIVTQCTMCPNGMRRSYEDASMCICSPNDGREMRNGECVKCNRGTFLSYDSEKCEPCMAGRFQNRMGKTFCDRCPPGTFTGDKGSVSCKKCPKGSFGNRFNGATSCVTPE